MWPLLAYDPKERRVAADDAALFVEPNDVGTFATAISTLLDEPAGPKSGKVGRERS